MATIQLEDVSRRFGDVVAVDGVSFEVAEGEIVGLLGHNGAGKTTLIRVINGLLPPDTGRVRVGGLDPVADGHRVRACTGVLTEYPALDDYLGVRENLEVYAAIHGVSRSGAAARIDVLLELLGLGEHAEVAARRLSAGLKQRVALARALVHDPAVLLLDEPTTNMDPVAARAVRQLILDAARSHGRTVLLSTHNLLEAESLCDRVAILRRGRMIAMGRPRDLRDRGVEGHGVRITTGGEGAQQLRAALGEGPQMRRTDERTVEIITELAVPTIVARLVAGGIEVHAVEPRATFEDLYVSVHQDEARQSEVHHHGQGTVGASTADSTDETLMS